MLQFQGPALPPWYVGFWNPEERLRLFGCMCFLRQALRHNQATFSHQSHLWMSSSHTFKSFMIRAVHISTFNLSWKVKLLLVRSHIVRFHVINNVQFFQIKKIKYFRPPSRRSKLNTEIPMSKFRKVWNR